MQYALYEPHAYQVNVSSIRELTYTATTVVDLVGRIEHVTMNGPTKTTMKRFFGSNWMQLVESK